MTQLRDVRQGLSLCAYELRKASEAAARAAFIRLTRPERGPGDDSARLAMEAELIHQGIQARIIAGSTIRLGDPARLDQWDLVMDPTEGAACLTKGLTNAMACLALAPIGSLFDPGPAFYMEKLVAPPQAAGHLDPTAPVAERLTALARCLDKPISQLTVYVLEKPRHRNLVEAIQAAGARVALYPAGDVAGAILAALPGSGIDALMGTGGAAEGLLAACAAKVMGGTFLARLDPQLTTERRAVDEAGLDTRTWMGLDQLVRSDNVVFCATGIASGLLLDGIERRDGLERTHSLLVGGDANPRQMLTTWHRAEG